jgi:hypothetical protein
MKFLLAVVAGLLISSQAAAQNSQRYEALCINIDSLAELVEEFGEDPSLVMTSIRETQRGQAEIPTVLFINYETKTWTMVERVTKDRYCVIATGENIKPYVKK